MSATSGLALSTACVEELQNHPNHTKPIRRNHRYSLNVPNLQSPQSCHRLRLHDSLIRRN